MKPYGTSFLLLFLPIFTIAQIDFSEGLRSYHPMNGDYYNVSSYDYIFHSNFHNAAFGANATDIENAAGAFDGASRVNLNTKLVNQIADFSVELWFRAESSFLQVLFWEGLLNQRSVWIRVEPANNRIRSNVGSGSSYAIVNTDSSFADGQWHHLVLTAANSNQVKVYIDGELNAEVSQNYTPGSTTNFTRFGCRESITQFLTGNLDEVRVWGYPLDANEVLALYHQPRILIDVEDAGEYCVGSAVQIPFEVIGDESFEADNTFYLQLSDKKGSFQFPHTIGCIAGTGSGIISGTLPIDIGTSEEYRLRVIASRYPKASDNSATITITNPNAVPGNDVLSNMILYYPFDGDATDYSGLGLDGSMSGSLVSVVDRNGNENSALSFGPAGRVDIGSPYPLTSFNDTKRPISVAFWLRHRKFKATPR